MAQMSVEQFATELGLLPAVLLEQLRAAGVKKLLAEDGLTEKDKAQLLDYLRKTHGATEAKSKITLTRRQTSEIRKSDSAGRPRTIQVEVRKRRVFTKPVVDEEAVKDEAVNPDNPDKVVEQSISEVVDAEQLALREEEARKNALLIARQAAEIKEKKSRKKSEAATVNKAEVETAVEKAELPKDTKVSQAPEKNIKSKGTKDEGVTEPGDKAQKIEQEGSQPLPSCSIF